MIGLHLADQARIALVHDQMQSGVTEDGKPQEGEHRRDQHDTDYKLANGATAANFGNKQPDKRGPSDRPAKNKQRPVANPV